VGKNEGDINTSVQQYNNHTPHSPSSKITINNYSSTLNRHSTSGCKRQHIYSYSHMLPPYLTIPRSFEYKHWV